MKYLTAKDVMTRDVLTVRADWPLSRLSEFLTEHDVSGAPVLSEEGKLIGVVSLTDIVRHDTLPQKEPRRQEPHDFYQYLLGQQYAAEELTSFRISNGDQATVGDIMTSSIYNVNEYTSVQQVAAVMIKGRIHRLFVTREDEIVGIITAMDMLKIIQEM